jgi:uncharacterized membrane protein YraQ (UPF0718 family)
MNKSKFYEKQWFMWFTLIFLSPVGIFLMWKYRRFNLSVRQILTGIATVWFIAICVYAVVSPDNETIVDKPAAKVVHHKTINVATMDLTESNVEKVAESVIPNNKIVKTTVVPGVNDAIVSVHFKLGDEWNEKFLVKDTANKAVLIFQELFKNPNISKIGVFGNAEMVDAKGNECDQDVISFDLSKENAKDIKWSNFKSMVASDYKSLINVADSYYINPSIKNKLK